MDIIYIIMFIVVQGGMGVVGAEIAGTYRRLFYAKQKQRVVAGCVGGLLLGQPIGFIVGEDNSFFALLGDVAAGLIGGFLAATFLNWLLRKNSRKTQLK